MIIGSKKKEQYTQCERCWYWLLTQTIVMGRKHTNWKEEEKQKLARLHSFSEWVIMECLLVYMSCHKKFAYMISLKPHINLWNKWYPHFTGDPSEAPTGEVICQITHSLWMVRVKLSRIWIQGPWTSSYNIIVIVIVNNNSKRLSLL